MFEVPTGRAVWRRALEGALGVGYSGASVAAFTSKEIVVLSADSGAVVGSRSATGRAAFTAFTLGPDGTSYAFAASDDERVSVSYCASLEATPRVLVQRVRDPCTSLALSPDGRRLALNGERVHLVDLETGSTRDTKGRGETARATAVAFSADGRRLVATFRDTIAILDPVTGERRIENGDACSKTGYGWHGSFCALAVSGSGSGIATGWTLDEGGDEFFVTRPRLRRIFLVTVPCAAGVAAHCIGSLKSLAFPPSDGKVAIAAGGSRVFFLDDPPFAGLVNEAVGALAFSPDGKTLAIGDRGPIARWDLEREGRIPDPSAYPHAPDHWPLELCFSPDGRVLASESAYGELRLRDVAKQRALHELKGFNVESESPRDGTFLAFSRDGETVARAVLGAKIVRFFNVRTGAGDRSVDLDAGVVILSEDATKVMCRRPGGEVHVVELRAGRSLWTLSSKSGPRRFRAFALSADRAAAVDEAGGLVTIWDATSGREIVEITLPQAADLTARQGVLRFSPDSRLLAVNLGEQVEVYDAKTGARRVSVRTGAERATALRFSPDGRMLAMGTELGTVLLCKTVEN